MYASLTDELCWDGLFGDVENYVANFRYCILTLGTLRRHQTALKPFPPTWPLEDIAVDLLGPLAQTRNKKWTMLVITDLYSKYPQVVTLGAVNAHVISAAVLHAWIFPLGLPNSILTENGPQFVVPFFQYVCEFLGVERVEITAYYLDSNVQKEFYNRTLAARLRHYVGYHKNDWSEYVDTVTYGYNNQVTQVYRA